MMLLLVWPALADVPWECPTFVDPVDAHAYRDTDLGLALNYSDLYDAAYAYYDETCAWVVTTTVEGESVIVERVCEGEGTRVTVRDASASSDVVPETFDGDSTRLVVEVDSGETWTRLEVTASSSSTTWGSWTSGGGLTTSAAWTGSVDGLPDDAWFEISTYDAGTSSGWEDTLTLETPGCRLRWTASDDGYTMQETVSTTDQWVQVYIEADMRCSTAPTRARVDDVVVGAVDWSTWERDPADADADGWVAPDCDCADDDPEIHVDAEDVPDDGIDQDCTGVARTTADMDEDGHDALSSGGGDCADEHPRVHPGADDRPGDGFDADCDGADDTDDDEDGYTADGDDLPADCDDALSAVHPGAPELPCDGVDQDCDGADACTGDTGDTGDTGGGDTGEEDAGDSDSGADDTGSGDEEREMFAPDHDDPGCGSGAAWLLLLPFVSTLRRRPARP